ncbi:hypothetical protein DFAR_3800040 [Desulfarculales bacterium]
MSIITQFQGDSKPILPAFGLQSC